MRAIENEIALGQIEEVIEMAKSELELVDYYYGNDFFLSMFPFTYSKKNLENRGWEKVEEAEAQADKLVEEMADSIYFNDPSKHQSA